MCSDLLVQNRKQIHGLDVEHLLLFRSLWTSIEMCIVIFGLWLLHDVFLKFRWFEFPPSHRGTFLNYKLRVCPEVQFRVSFSHFRT